MGGFFKGWRRKAGCVTLMMAIAATAVWIRSQCITDSFTTDANKDGSRIILDIDPEGLKWTRTKGSGYEIMVPKFLGIIWYSDESQVPRRASGWRPDWERTFCGFRFGKYLCGGIAIVAEREESVIPYWSIDLPLVLLSAYLLLVKPRVAKPMKMSEPVPAEAP